MQPILSKVCEISEIIANIEIFESDEICEIF